MRKWAPRGPLPSLNHLPALEATARLGSFRAAADEMGVTQGAVAQQIRGLEAELGRPLFDRLPRGLAPTAAGREFVGRARLALEIVALATAELMRDGPGEEEGRIVVSATPSLASRWLIPRLHRFADRHPAVPVMIDASDQWRPLHGTGRVDLAIRWGRPPFAGTTARFLLPGRAIAVCAPSLAAGQGWSDPAARDPAVLAGVPLISDGHRLWPRWFAVHGRAGTAFAGPCFSQTHLAIEAAERGLGVALVPQLLAAGALQEGRLVKALGEPYELDSELAFYVVTAEDRPSTPAITAMVDWLLLEAAR